MELINAPLRAAFDAILGPFSDSSPMLTLVPLSIVVGAVALVAFKWTSNQRSLARARSLQQAGFFEIRLYNDQLGNIFRAQGRILRATGRYMLLILLPLLVLVPPLFLVVAQLQFRYGYEGLQPGDDTLLRVRLTEEAIGPGKPRATIDAPEGVSVETPSVWIPTERLLVWRIRATAPGEHELAVELADVRATKSLSVSEGVLRRSPIRPSASLASQLLYPAEEPLPGGAPIASIEVGYPDGGVNFLWWRVNWIIAFFALTVVVALILRKPLKVTI